MCASFGYYHFHTYELIMQKFKEYLERETSGKILKGTTPNTFQSLDLCI